MYNLNAELHFSFKVRLNGSKDIVFGGLSSVSVDCFENVEIIVKIGEKVMIDMLVVVEKKTLGLKWLRIKQEEAEITFKPLSF